MKILRIYTDDRGSFIEVPEIVKIVEVEKKFKAGDVEYDTHKEAQAALTPAAKPVEPPKEIAVEDTTETVSVTEAEVKTFNLTISLKK